MCVVYEHIVFEGQQHRSIRSIPGMAERTLRLGSAGKTFSFTDWKVGCSCLVSKVPSYHAGIVSSELAGLWMG